MFWKGLLRGEGVLHHFIEGKKVGVDGSKIVDIDRRPDRCPRRHSGGTESKGGGPPYFFFILSLPLDGRRFPPLVHGLHGGGPPRLDLPLCSLLFRLPQIWPKNVSYIPGDP